MSSEEEQDEEEAEEPEVRLAWEETLQQLPKEFQHILLKVRRREQPIPVKSLLEKIPVFEGLPRTAPVNNHRRDGLSKYDKVLKIQQQQLLHLARLHSYLYMGVQEGADKEMLLQLMQQTFQLLLEYNQKAEDQRKEDSIPGSIPQENQQLFHKEDIQMATLNRNIQGAKGTHQGFSSSSTRFATPLQTSTHLQPLHPDRGRGSTDFEATSKEKASETSPTKAMAASPEVLTQMQIPPLTLSLSQQGSAMAAMEAQEDLVMETKAKVARQPQQQQVCYTAGPVETSNTIPYFLSLRNRMPWWQRHGSLQVQYLVTHGVPCPYLPPELSKKPCIRNLEQTQAALKVLEEYREIGAVKLVGFREVKHLIPWFVLEKVENGKKKVRFISDCREINAFQSPPAFRMDHWGIIFPVLRKNMWGGGK